MQEDRGGCVRHYYVAIRHFRTNDDVTFEGLQPALNSMLPLIRERIIAYYVLEAGEGILASNNLTLNVTLSG
jgi:hypothetical protein